MTIEKIKSPLPGVFYITPEPNKPPYIKVGDTIEVGTVVGLVEVMKTFNEVKSEHSGKVVAILVANEDSVSAGDDLIEIEI